MFRLERQLVTIADDSVATQGVRTHVVLRIRDQVCKIIRVGTVQLVQNHIYTILATQSHTRVFAVT